MKAQRYYVVVSRVPWCLEARFWAVSPTQESRFTAGFSLATRYRTRREATVAARHAMMMWPSFLGFVKVSSESVA